METNNFSFHRLGMLVRTEFLTKKKIWGLIFSVYFAFVLFFLFATYSWNEKSNFQEMITNVFSLSTPMCFVMSVFLSQMGIRRYTSRNEAIIALTTPASKGEKYLTILFYCLGLPLFILTFLPLIMCNFVENRYYLDNITWVSVLILFTLNVNFMRKGVLRFLITFVLALAIVLLFNYASDIHLTISIVYIVIGAIALITSWYLFKNYSTDKIWDKR